MRIKMMASVAAACLALAACGGNGDDALGEQAQESADNQAASLDAAADNATGTQAESLEAQADAVEEAGEAKEEAIDDADVNADAMSNAQKAEITNAM